MIALRPETVLDCGGRPLNLSRPQVMGVLNLTPDSFSDGGRYNAPDAALDRAAEMVTQGAAVIDVGGESTRPGARPVSAAEELDRVIPVIEAVARDLPVAVSIDSSKPEVMAAAVSAGAGLINDVQALRADGALALVAGLGVPVCLMHMRGTPGTMQDNPRYGDVVAEVIDFLRDRVDACLLAGIARERLIVDPGIGFGKSLTHNLILLQRLKEFQQLGLPLLVGVSRKSLIGAILDLPVSERLYGSIALTSLAVWQGARLIRAHDVKETVEAVRICEAVMAAAVDAGD